ncbi:hypothetical protein PCK1_003166 [Pneumocystis canis]|nr:hypothetical protein PCK1_003166 [Pneumocystis canis]
MVNNMTCNYIAVEPLKPLDASSLNIRSISISCQSNSVSSDTYNTKNNQKPNSSSIKFPEILSQQDKTENISKPLHDINDENVVDGVYIDENDIDDDLNLDSEHDESSYSWSSSPLEYQNLLLSGFKDQLYNNCRSSDSVPESKLPNISLSKEASCQTQVYCPLNPLEVELQESENLVKNTNLNVQPFFDPQKHISFTSTSKAQPVFSTSEKNESFLTSRRICPWDEIESSTTMIKSEMKNHKRIASNISKRSDAYNIDSIQSHRFELKGIRKNSIDQNKNRKLPGLFLSEEQKIVLKIVVEERKSIFFTGSAGTGKSILLREIIASLRKKYAKEPGRVAITASTGLAACNIGGVTLHSYAGIGLGRDSFEDLCRKIRKNKKCLSRWLRTKVLIIDEISMVDAELFDKLENIARKLRNNENPFGGIQVIVTGDFFQLPPVSDQGRAAKFAFEAKKWKDVISHTITLTHVFRQKDQDFVEMLNELRLGHLSHNSIKKFCSLDRELEFDDGLEPTELFPTRSEVDKANATRMRSLSGVMRTFEALDSGTVVDKTQRDKLLSNCMAPARIDLKEGAQVMLIKNFDDQLVNGSLGKVIGFMNEKTFQIWQEDEPDDDPFSYYEHIDDSNVDEIKRRKKRRIAKMQSAAATGKLWPLVRFTLSNGLTRDIYVALSRATSQKGLQVLHFEVQKVMAHPKVSLFYKSLVNTVDLKKKNDAGYDLNKEKNMDHAVSIDRVILMIEKAEIEISIFKENVYRILDYFVCVFQVFLMFRKVRIGYFRKSCEFIFPRRCCLVQTSPLLIQKCFLYSFERFKGYNQTRTVFGLNQIFQKSFISKKNGFLGKIKKLICIFVVLGLIKSSYDIYEFHRPMPLMEPDPNKKTIVVLGTGWGSMSLLKTIKSDDYNIVVISPRNYFLFTPLLPSCTTGAVEFRSIIEPIIYMIRHKKTNIRFYEASCTSIDPDNKIIAIKDSSNIDGDAAEMKLSYDYLVIGIGAENQTFGISGVNKYANFLKEISDARRIRSKIMECIKAALFKEQTNEEKQRLLSMVVVGGGPTGIEFAAELSDFFEEDLKKWYPEISNIFKIKLIEALPSVLPMFSKTLINYTEAVFKEENIEIFTKSVVKSVADKYITVETTTSDNKKVTQKIPYGLLVWATGNSPRSVIKNLISKIPEQSGSSRGLVVNDYLVVKGTENIWAIGDCTATKYAPTAQVAFQQGQYLANLFDMLSKSRKFEKEIQYLENLLSDNIDFEKKKIIKKDIDAKTKKMQRLSIVPFEFSYRGSLAYIGNNKAIADLSFLKGSFPMYGTIAFLFWRSAYASMLFSLRNKILVCLDWIKVFTFGRDVGRI